MAVLGPAPSTCGTHYQCYLPGHTCALGTRCINLVGSLGGTGEEEDRGRNTEAVRHWFGWQDDWSQGGPAEEI